MGKDRSVGRCSKMEKSKTYINNMQRLIHTSLRVKRKARIHLGRDLARDDLEDLAAKLDEQAVERGVDLVVEVFALNIDVHVSNLP